MKLVRSIALSFAVATAASLSVIACGGTVEQPQTAVGVTKAPIGTNTHGFVKIVGEALGDVPLRAEQRVELEKLAQAAEARHAPTAQGRKDLMLAIADQVEKGAIDRPALQPKIDKVVADIESVRTEDRAAIVKLHDTLDTEQRNTFVDALETRMKAKRGEHSPMKGFAKMHQLADDLKLTDAQKAQVMSTLKDMHHDHATAAGGEHKKEWAHGETGKREHFGHRGHHGKKAFEAFRADKLDLDQAAPPVDLKEKATKGTTHIVGVAEKILPILTPEQRKIAADKLRTMAEKGEEGLIH